MVGGPGDDTYLVDNPGDTPIEKNAEGTDTVISSISFTLGTYVENLILTGTGDINGTGNDPIHNAPNTIPDYSGNNVIIGNSGANVLDGLGGDDTLIGNDGNDLLKSGAGSDTLLGGNGDDGLYFGASFDASDVVDGGTGFNQLGLQGNYAGSGLTLDADSLVNIQQVVLLAGNDARFGDVSGSLYSYALTTVDANVGAGQRLAVSWNNLRDGENVAFNGSAETDGWFLTFAGHGADHITGGQQDDGFFFGYGMWGIYDTVDGQGGSLDQLGLQGNYTAAGSGPIVFGGAQLAGIEMIVCVTGGDRRFGAPSGQGYSYDLTMNDGNVGAGQTLYISANTLKAADGSVLLVDETLTFDGSAESDGRFVIYSGAGADHITGGAGDDVIYGGAGADELAGGAGNDVFAYVGADHSTASAMDRILDFASGDQIDLSVIDAIADGADDTCAFVGAAAFSHTAGELRAFEQNPGHWQVEGDVDGDGTADLVIAVTTGHALSAADFAL
jgi:Ca2+-binding RTX toxin-like protein